MLYEILPGTLTGFSLLKNPTLQIMISDLEQCLIIDFIERRSRYITQDKQIKKITGVIDGIKLQDLVKLVIFKRKIRYIKKPFIR